MLSEHFQSQPTNIIELVPGEMQHTDVDFSGFSFPLCSAPNVGAECKEFFQKLRIVLSDCSKNRVIFF